MTLPHPNADQISLPIVLAVLGDPTRLAIVCFLASKEGVPMNCSKFLDLGSKTNLSYHLAKLREAGVTRTEAVGTNRMITLRRDDLDRRFPGLLDSVIAAAGDDKALPMVGAAEIEIGA
ncbi:MULTISPECIES: helix-turn-helix transcriptional regulator [Mesorhizobium]|uniref:ArsR/SmtB family transcription factor n=1 Tax=Mesorhizobium TaxID=68287 RepID=UPI000FCC23DD|nr:MULTISPECIES: helix-turn-helix transcriptional regulator [Mesorhizobium]MDX8433201.1 helix-turn-helix transcriptional regulator [Mesorhizobium abyssinicae]RUW75913.1 transcriptional regulator [Mesorhizobium sp. M4B.F.Ca.ET.049.02.1.2]RVD15093.1 transcriptional regulator [Mesorhizobium sp. M4B.F.Ca.ET.017.02.2.1]TGV28303.1 transcriptional regulator [Mesorhizobium sp. M4B.F.Ca.ET.143.01.1.1]